MSKSQTLEDLKKTGVKLSQSEAQEIHTRIGDIAKGIHESGELFEVVEAKEMGQANNVQASTGFTPLNEDAELLNESDSVLIIENDPENNFDESLNIDDQSEDKEDTEDKTEVAAAVVEAKVKAPAKPKAEKAAKAPKAIKVKA